MNPGFDQAMDEVQRIIASQKDDNQLTPKESKLFLSAMRAFHYMAIGSSWPAAGYFGSLDGLLESGWLPETGWQDVANLATQRQMIASRIVRPQDKRRFAFSESFNLIYPDVKSAKIVIVGSESHDSADLEDNSIMIHLPREFWNVAVLTMGSEFLWKASSSNYSKQMSNYVTLNHVRTKGIAHYENSKHMKINGSSVTSGRDGHGNYFSAEASGEKLVEGEIPISFSARSHSRML